MSLQSMFNSTLGTIGIQASISRGRAGAYNKEKEPKGEKPPETAQKPQEGAPAPGGEIIPPQPVTVPDEAQAKPQEEKPEETPEKNKKPATMGPEQGIIPAGRNEQTLIRQIQKQDTYREQKKAIEKRIKYFADPTLSDISRGYKGVW